jgi:hypothetical protein
MGDTEVEVMAEATTTIKIGFLRIPISAAKAAWPPSRVNSHMPAKAKGSRSLRRKRKACLRSSRFCLL